MRGDWEAITMSKIKLAKRKCHGWLVASWLSKRPGEIAKSVAMMQALFAKVSIHGASSRELTIAVLLRGIAREPRSIRVDVLESSVPPS